MIIIDIVDVKTRTFHGRLELYSQYHLRELSLKSMVTEFARIVAHTCASKQPMLMCVWVDMCIWVEVGDVTGSGIKTLLKKIMDDTFYKIKDSGI